MLRTDWPQKIPGLIKRDANKTHWVLTLAKHQLDAGSLFAHLSFYLQIHDVGT